MIIAILLAAGDAAVDGVPLGLLPWRGDSTLIEFQVSGLLGAGIDLMEVVLGHEAEGIIPLIAGDLVEPIVDMRWQQGAEGWIRTGAAAAPRESSAALLVRLDEPATSAVYRQLIAEHLRGGAAITLATFEGAAGTPLVVDAAVLAELRNVTPASGGLAGVLASHPAETLTVQFHNIVRISTREDYVRARTEVT